MLGPCCGCIDIQEGGIKGRGRGGGSKGGLKELVRHCGRHRRGDATGAQATEGGEAIACKVMRECWSVASWSFRSGCMGAGGSQYKRASGGKLPYLLLWQC